MSVLSEQLKQIGYEPTPQRKKPRLDSIVTVLLAPHRAKVKRRKLIVQKAGDFLRVRFQGRTTNCFALDLNDAQVRLRRLGEHQFV